MKRPALWAKPFQSRKVRSSRLKQNSTFVVAMAIMDDKDDPALLCGGKKRPPNHVTLCSLLIQKLRESLDFKAKTGRSIAERL